MKLLKDLVDNLRAKIRIESEAIAPNSRLEKTVLRFLEVEENEEE